LSDLVAGYVCGVNQKGVLAVVRKVIKRRIRHEKDGVNVAADIDAVIAVNTGQPGQTSRNRVRSRRRIVQRSGTQQAPDTGERTPPDEKPPEGR
jgi:hypothetical protein